MFFCMHTQVSMSCGIVCVLSSLSLSAIWSRLCNNGIYHICVKAMCGSKGGTGGLDPPPEKSQKYRVS